jgi:ABC-2 type transport system permease protein
VFSKLGATGTGADAVFGVCFLIEAILIGFVAAGQVTAARAEESEGTLDNFMVRPVTRSSWLGGRLLVALVVLVLSGVAAGALGWLGAASQHTGLSFTSLLGAGINLVPPAIVILGIGVLTLGLLPRATSIVVLHGVGLVAAHRHRGRLRDLSHWILDTSVFHHMASAPGVPPNWEANGIMIGIGLAATLRRSDDGTCRDHDNAANDSITSCGPTDHRAIGSLRGLERPGADPRVGPRALCS